MDIAHIDTPDVRTHSKKMKNEREFLLFSTNN